MRAPYLQVCYFFFLAARCLAASATSLRRHKVPHVISSQVETVGLESCAGHLFAAAFYSSAASI